MLASCVLAGGCGEKAQEKETDSVNVSKEQGKETDSEKEEPEPEMIDGFEKAEYEKFNSYAEENGLDGTNIYIDGVVKERSSENTYIFFVLEQEDGNQWLVASGREPLRKIKALDSVIGKKVRVFASYMGFSDKFEMPSCHIQGPNFYIEQTEKLGEKITWNDYKASRKQIVKWFNKNDCELLFSKSEKKKFADTYKASTGVVEEARQYSDDTFIDFYQKKGDEYVSQLAIIKNITYDDIEDLGNLSAGDGIKLYYYIGEENEISFLAFEKADPPFSLEEVEMDYKNKCKEYTYEDIARNPEETRGNDAKFRGEVIQVLEDGNSVEMRVNITKESYGYSDTIYVSYDRKSENEDRILEDDIITIYGKLGGLETYTSILGADITLPQVFAEYIEIEK